MNDTENNKKRCFSETAAILMTSIISLIIPILSFILRPERYVGFDIAKYISNAIGQAFAVLLIPILVVYIPYFYNRLVKKEKKPINWDIFVIVWACIFAIMLIGIFISPKNNKTTNNSIEKQLSNKKYSIEVIVTRGDARGTTDAHFDKKMLKGLEKWTLGRAEKVFKNAAKQNKELSNIKFTAKSYYIIFKGKKLAVVHVDSSKKLRTVSIYGIDKNELVRVYCHRLGGEEINYYMGDCGKGLSKEFNIDLTYK